MSDTDPKNDPNAKKDPGSKSDPPADPPTNGGGGDRTFSQADVDRIVQERLGRERQRFSDYEDLKAKAAKLDEIEAASKSELEKATERASKAEQEAQQIREAANRRLVEAAVIAAATKAKVLKPEHMPRLIDTGSVTVGDDGQVTGAEDAVTAFLEANPEYVGASARPGGADQGARGGAQQLGADALQTMSAEEIVKAQKEGRLDSVLKGA